MGSRGAEREAYTSIPIIQESQIQIACMARTGPYLFLGTNDGKILAYSIQGERENVKADLLGSKTIPSKKKIEQMEAIGDIGILVVLADGQLNMYSLKDLAILPASIVVRQIKTFCIDQRGPPAYRLCIASKKKLQLYLYDKENNDYKSMKDINLPDVPLTMLWNDDMICVGFRKEYAFVNVETGELITSNLSIDPVKTTPVAAALPGDEILVAALDRVGIYMNFQGAPLPRNSLTWNTSPACALYDFPHVVSLAPQRGVEVHSNTDQRRVQLLSIKGALTMVSGQKMWRSGTPGSHRGSVTVATLSEVYVLQPTPFRRQSEESLKQGRVDEALELLKASFDYSETEEQIGMRMAKFHEEAGKVLLSQLRFSEAMRHLAECDMDPRDILAYFPELQAKDVDYRPRKLKPETLNCQPGGPMDMATVISEGHRRDMQTSKTQRELLLEAHVSLIQFLEHGRRQGLSDDQADRAVDTALLRLYLTQKRHKEVFDMIEEGTNVSVEECEPFLEKNQMYDALSLLYLKHNDEKNALEILSKLGSGEYVQKGNDGVDATIEILQKIDDEDLVWTYSAWVLRSHPNRGLKIFTKRRNLFPPEKVLSHLKSFPDKYLPVQYLEFIVIERRSPDSRYHTELATIYLDNVMDEKRHTQRDTVYGGIPGSEPGRLGGARKRLLQFLDFSDYLETDELLQRTKGTFLIAEYVALCNKANMHEEALRTLLYELQDSGAAEQYCLKHGGARSQGELYHDNHILLALLQMYLRPQDTRKAAAFREEAMKLLKNHAKLMSPVRVMEILPDDLPIADLSEYFGQTLPYSAYRVRDAMVVRNLRRYECLQMACRRAERLSQYVEITPDTKCQLDGKRIGDTIFAAYPNGTLVKYKYTDGDLSTDPVTGETFGI